MEIHDCQDLTTGSTNPILNPNTYEDSYPYVLLT